MTPTSQIQDMSEYSILVALAYIAHVIIDVHVPERASSMFMCNASPEESHALSRFITHGTYTRAL